MKCWALFRAASRWDRLSLAQLKDELAMRGLKRSGTREVLVSRLEECEIHSKLTSKPSASQFLEEKPWKNAGKDLLIAEIRKRRPNEAVNPRYPKEKLMEILQNLLQMEGNLGVQGVKISTLLPRLNTSSTESEVVAVEEVLEVVGTLVDLEKVEQSELNVLVNGEVAEFYRLWSLLYAGVEGMKGEQLILMLRFIHLFNEVLKKPPTTGSPGLDASAMETIAQKLRTYKPSLALNELSTAVSLLSQLSVSKPITDTITAFQTEILARLHSHTHLSLPPTQLFSVFESLPQAAFTLNPSAVSWLISSLFRPDLSYSSPKLLSILHKFYEIKAPMPFPLISHLSSLSRDILKRLNPVSLYHVLRLMCEQRCLTINMTETIWEM